MVGYVLGGAALLFLGYEAYQHFHKQSATKATSTPTTTPTTTPPKNPDFPWALDPSTGNTVPNYDKVGNVKGLIVPTPAPNQPDTPPSIYLGPDGPMAGDFPAKEDFDRVIRETLAYDSDPVSVDRVMRVAKDNGWKTAAGMLELKRNGLIAHPQPYPYLRKDFPSYLVSDQDGHTINIIWDGSLDEKALGVVKYYLANELDMGNLAHLQSLLESQGYPRSAQNFANKYNAQATLRKNVGVGLPQLSIDSGTGRILPVSMNPVPNPLPLFASLSKTQLGFRKTSR